MKLRITKPASKSFFTKTVLVITSALIVVAAPMHLMTNTASADEYDDKINALKAQIAEYNEAASKLAEQASTLQTAVASLQAQAAVIQAQIDISQTKYDQLIAQIAETEVKIKNNQDALGRIIADMYVNSDVSSLEMLASSKNIGDYLNKQEYRSAASNSLTNVISKIKDLRTQLNEQKVEVGRVLEDQKTARAALVAKQTEQQTLLDQTRGQEAAYQQLVAQNQSQIREVRAAQAAYFASLSANSGNTLLAGDPNKGGYPAYLANAGQDSLVDPWGMYNRECVSYVAWKVHQNYGNMPYWGGIGNAWEWAYSGYHNGYGVRVFYDSGYWHQSNAEAWGIPYGSDPKPGSVAVSSPTPGNPYGHVAWVEGVSGDKITISQYNWYVASLGGWGQYSEMVVDKSIFQRYIYFGEW